ncbi:transposable element Tcb1 transposase [Trichonephila clavipes]|nr:transposable element Tcb1 transposase [Trichonephila clavipes]
MNEQKINLEFCFELSKTPKETYAMMVRVYEDQALSVKCVYEWFTRFQEGMQSVSDNPYSRRLAISVSDENIEKGREIDQRVGRNQATVMRICHRWMQGETRDRRGQSHPPRCTTERDDRWIVRREVMDRTATSKTTDSACYASFGVRTYHTTSFLAEGNDRKTPTLLRLPLTGNHRHFHRQWGGERQTWTTEWNDIVFTDESRLPLAIFQQENA